MWITPISYAIGPKCRRLKVTQKFCFFGWVGGGGCRVIVKKGQEGRSISQISLSRKVFLMHLHSSYDKVAIKLPPFSIYCEQACILINNLWSFLFPDTWTA